MRSLRKRNGGNKSAPCGLFEVTEQEFAYSTNLLRHIFAYEQLKVDPLEAKGLLATLTRRPTEQNVTTMGLPIMCFDVVCYASERQKDYEFTTLE